MEIQETMQIGVPKIIYETIEDILEAQIRRLAIDIAKTLNVDSKILMKELKKEKIKTYLFEDGSDVNISCKSYTQHNNLYISCKHPIVYGEQYCISHLESPILYPYNANKLIEILYSDTKYYRDIENNVYNSEGIIMEQYKYNSSKQKIYQFVLEN